MLKILNTKKIKTSASARRMNDKRGGGAVKTLSNFSKATFPSLTVSVYATQGIENDVSARLPSITSAFCDHDLLPPYTRRRPFMPLLMQSQH